LIDVKNGGITLGPKERAQRVVDQMLAPAPKNLVAPAGLDLGGDGAHAIALSIVAQIQAQYENMSAQSLAIKAQGIHD
jgi:xanthine/CO dehydrogenase XdhC/CoxF family maturation factor